MKPIRIKKRFHLFSTKPGSQIPIAQMGVVFTLYPTEIELSVEGKVQRWQLDFQVQLKEFKVFFDPIKNEIDVELKSLDSFFAYRLAFFEKGWQLTLKRSSPKKSLRVKKDNSSTFETLALHESFFLAPQASKDGLRNEPQLLFCGVHKKADVEAIQKRRDIREYLPFLYLFAQMSPTENKETTPEFDQRLKKLKESIEQAKHDEMTPLLDEIYQFFFTSFFTPTYQDPDKWFSCSKTPQGSDFSILSLLYPFLGRLFFEKTSNGYHFLPHLPKELFTGKLIHVKENDFEFDLEWSKKKIFRMTLRAIRDSDKTLYFGSKIKSYRIRVDNNSTIYKNGDSIRLRCGAIYQLDRFTQ